MEQKKLATLRIGSLCLNFFSPVDNEMLQISYKPVIVLKAVKDQDAKEHRVPHLDVGTCPC